MAARPATRHTRERQTPDVQVRAPVRDLNRGSASFAIDWDVRPVYDFVFSLSGDAGSTDDLPATDRKWLADAKADLPAEVRDAATRLFESEVAIHIAVVVVDRPALRTADDVVAAISSSDPRDVIRAIANWSPREADLTTLVDRALAGDSSALTALEETMPEYKREARLQMLREPETTVADLVSVLAAWAERFTPIESRVTAILERDYEARAADRATLAPVDLIERTTGGIRWLAEGGVKRVILAPSYFSRPYNFLMSASDFRLFAYPVSDEALESVDPLAAPQSVVRLHRALGDDTRLRILKLLAGRDLYLTEIAQLLELSKPTIKHHLALLRSAGLVTITESGTVIYYSLRRNRLDDASADIKRFLIG
jgi:DNA-binding transcriptional ArsR family regulator